MTSIYNPVRAFSGICRRPQLQQHSYQGSYVFNVFISMISIILHAKHCISRTSHVKQNFPGLCRQQLRWLFECCSTYEMYGGCLSAALHMKCMYISCGKSDLSIGNNCIQFEYTFVNNIGL